MIPKPGSDDFEGRFRNIIADPLNLLIRRHPLAGMVEEGKVVLHNGNRVPVDGPLAYYEDFSRIFVLNRGVHEPLEEFCFQSVLARMPERPVMVELGAYWAHYSMWMAQVRPQARLFMVEPDADNIAAGRANFAANGYQGTFRQELVGPEAFGIDRFMTEVGLTHLDVLHADIQGAEGPMLVDAARALAARAIDWLVISTHWRKVHQICEDLLTAAGYRIEVSSDFVTHTTSHDGFILASSPAVAPIFLGLPKPLGREDLATADPGRLVAMLQALLPAVPAA